MSWKVLGSIAILVPRFPLIKEWAYAGIMIDLTGAAYTSIATGGEWWHAAAPLSIEGRVAWARQEPGLEGIGVEFRCRDTGGLRRLKELVRRLEGEVGTVAPTSYSASPIA